MAVVFISPKQRQKTFFLGITVIFLLFLAAVGFAVFLSQPKPVSPEIVFNKPKISIDTKIFDSEQFKNLQPFAEMKIRFAYTARTTQGESETGIITAVSENEAKKILEDAGMAVIDLKEAGI